jgi:uncharacterized protein YcfJ
MNTSAIITGTILLASSASLAYANPAYQDNAFYDEATVVNVEPVIRTVQVTEPQRECYTEEIRTPVYQAGTDPGGATVVGGVVGGILGHKLSHGRGGATVAGTLIGAAIGNELGKANAVPPSYHEEISYQDRCEVRYLTRNEAHTEGYRVSYRYKGEIFTTQLPHAPGKHLRLRVSLSPINE